MSARIIFLPMPEIGEPPEAFRKRFAEWRQNRNPQPATPGFHQPPPPPAGGHDPKQLAFRLFEPIAVKAGEG